jgi:hypothetical protein
VKLAAATTIAVGAGSLAWAAEKQGAMPYRTLGRTGEQISVIGLGGYHIGKQADEQGSIRLIRSAVDGGITFMDNCWDYDGGASEIRMGKALCDGYRDKVFLMTKIDGRTKDSAAPQIDESLERLQTDRIDLMQFHEVIRMEDPDSRASPGGSAHIHPVEQGNRRDAARPHSRRGGNWQIRAVQDFKPIRRNGAQSTVAGLGP